jgi:hypothetical protein
MVKNGFAIFGLSSIESIVKDIPAGFRFTFFEKYSIFEKNKPK